MDDSQADYMASTMRKGMNMDTAISGDKVKALQMFVEVDGRRKPLKGLRIH